MSEVNRESDYSINSYINLKEKLNGLFCSWNEDGSDSDIAKNLILDMWRTASGFLEKKECIDMVTIMPNKVVAKQMLNDMAFESYTKTDFEVAAHGFMRGTQMGDVTSKNNLVYMLRRGETNIIPDCSARDYLKILRSGLGESEAFSMVNAALVLSVGMGEERDWEVADKLISFLPAGCFSIINWWSDLERKGDPEGFLIHLWLIRHKKMERSPLAGISELRERVSEEFPNSPKWLFETKKDLNVDDLIAKIDQKIAELEEEERKEKEEHSSNEDIPQDAE